MLKNQTSKNKKKIFSFVGVKNDDSGCEGHN